MASHPSARGQNDRFINVFSTQDGEAAPTFDEVLEWHVNAVSMVSGKTSWTSRMIDHMLLSHKWGISPAVAWKTIRKTIQRGLQMVLHQSLF